VSSTSLQLWSSQSFSENVHLPSYTLAIHGYYTQPIQIN